MPEDDDGVIAEMIYKDLSLKIIEVPTGDTIKVISHQPFDNGYTCAVPHATLQALNETNVIAPFLTIINAMLQLLVIGEAR